MQKQQKSSLLSLPGAVRPIIENVKPEVSGGRYAVKRIVGKPVAVDATVFIDGHEILAAEVLYRHHADKQWNSARLLPHPRKKDLWNATFTPEKLGEHLFTVRAWIDRFASWKSDLEKKHTAGQDVSIDFLIGDKIFKKAAKSAKGKDLATLNKLVKLLASTAKQDKKVAEVLKPEVTELMNRHPDRHLASTYERELRVNVEREKAQFSTWYEFFPRSFGKDGKHGTFKDCEKMLPYVADLKFDVVYLPPIHPIGTSFRKGKNNSLTAGPNDPGSPWGIGNVEGGHKTVHTQLGTLADFKRFVKKAQSYGIEVAMDLAYQCAPEHPYVKEHPEWFKKRPDGTIQYAENPPKKYQDIYPFDFESEDWPALWTELKSVVEFWIKQGIRIFRVDNPHTKSCRYWEWMIADIRKKYPETIFLAEAFTRPAMMYYLAKIGFSQSYTYFTWRNTKEEFRKYLEELTRTEVAEYYRPNFWPNTPDILPIHLQTGHAGTFKARVALAATMSSNYGLYGPAYELLEHQPLHQGGEEYLNSEKYETRDWDLNAKHSIKDFIGKLNQIRRQNPALHGNDTIQFHGVDNDQIIAYSKHSADQSNIVLVAVNLDFTKKQSGNWTLPLESLGIGPKDKFKLVDLLGQSKGKAQEMKMKGNVLSISLDPDSNPVAIYRLVRTAK